MAKTCWTYPTIALEIELRQRSAKALIMGFEIPKKGDVKKKRRTHLYASCTYLSSSKESEIEMTKRLSPKKRNIIFQ